MPFNDPKVVEAIEMYGHFSRNDAYVDGGAGAVASIDFRDSPAGMFTSPPQCYMHRQASFIPAFFPEAPRLVLTLTSSTSQALLAKIWATQYWVAAPCSQSPKMPSGTQLHRVLADSNRA